MADRKQDATKATKTTNANPSQDISDAAGLKKPDISIRAFRRIDRKFWALMCVLCYGLRKS